MLVNRLLSKRINTSFNLIRTFSTQETIINKSDIDTDFVNNILAKKTVATLGYGPQAMSQAMNLRDNGHNVILGIRKSDKKNSSWNKALTDNWIEGTDLFEIDEAVHKGDIIQNLLSDAGQIDQWKTVNSNLSENNSFFCLSIKSWTPLDGAVVSDPSIIFIGGGSLLLVIVFYLYYTLKKKKGRMNFQVVCLLFTQHVFVLF